MVSVHACAHTEMPQPLHPVQPLQLVVRSAAIPCRNFGLPNVAYSGMLKTEIDVAHTADSQGAA